MSGYAPGGGAHPSASWRVSSLLFACFTLSMHSFTCNRASHLVWRALMLSNNGDLARSLKSCEEFKQPGMDYYCATHTGPLEE